MMPVRYEVVQKFGPLANESLKQDAAILVS